MAKQSLSNCDTLKSHNAAKQLLSYYYRFCLSGPYDRLATA